MDDQNISNPIRTDAKIVEYLGYTLQNGEYFTQLCQAIANDDVAQVRLVLKDQPAPNFAFALFMEPIIKAVEGGNVEIVKALIKAGADIHGTNNPNDNILFDALDAGHADIVRLLVHEGVNVNHQSRLHQNQTPLHVAAEKNNPDLVAAILSAPDTRINQRMENGDTALHIAACRADKSVVMLLTEHGVELEPRNALGDTPFLAAVRADKIENAAHLYTLGANIEARTIFDETALHLSSSMEMTHFLRDAGIDPDLCDHLGNRAKPPEPEIKPAIVRAWKQRKTSPPAPGMKP